MASNYEKMLLGAKELFLRRDQEEMIRIWGLEHDGESIRFELFSRPMTLDRKTARLGAAGGEDMPPINPVNDSMIVFDLLTRPSERPKLKGEWASISMLGGVIGAGHDRLLGHDRDAAFFSGAADALAEACRRMNGLPFGKSDVGYVIPVFRDFSAALQFWDGDDEFPARLKFLFDANALDFMHYETLWYVMEGITERLKYYFGEKKGKAG